MYICMTDSNKWRNELSFDLFQTDKEATVEDAYDDDFEDEKKAEAYDDDFEDETPEGK